MIAALLALAALGPAGDVPPADPGDDLLVILLDDVGKDLLAVYGGPEPAHTPHLDLLAANGRTYDRAYATPLCAPSRACLLTGRYGFRTGFGTNLRNQDPFRLAAAEACVPELLPSDAGLAVEVVGKWHLTPSLGVAATDRHAVDACGFERFLGHVSNLGAEVGLPGTDHYRWRRVDATAGATDVLLVDGYAAGDLSEATWATAVGQDALAASLNALAPGQRAVAFWHPVAPHAPFQAPPATLVSPQTAAGLEPPPYEAEPGEERAYALAMLEALDALIGELFAELHPERRARLTVIVVGDNGTAEPVLHPSLDASRAKGTVYEPGVGVPLIVSGRAVASPGTRDASLVHVVDLPATIAELVGAAAPVGEDSVSFHRTYAQGLPGLRTSVFTERFTPNGAGEGSAEGAPPATSARAVIEARYKLVRFDGSAATDELYDLLLDPGETLNLLSFRLASGQQAAYDRLRATLDGLLGRPSDAFCDASDGALAACPCAPGAAQTGCDLSQGTGGAGLTVARQTTVPENRATLVGTGFPALATPAVVLRATGLDPGAPVVFGDGLRCVGVPLVRLAPAVAAGGVSRHVVGHGAEAGSGTRTYQLWFRNTPAAYCDPTAAFNLSSGRNLAW